MEDANLKEIFDQINKNMTNSELVKDNKFLFSYEDKWYAIRMPNQKELAIANRNRKATIVKLYQKGKVEGYLGRDALIKLLKEKNDIDINKMDDEINKLIKKCVQIHLTASKKKDNEKKQLKELEKQRNDIQEQIKNISNKKAEHLALSIENQAEDVWYKVLVSLCTLKLIDEKSDKWEKVWKDFNDFENDESNLPYLAEAHLATFIQNV